MTKILIISKIYTHPTEMGNSWGILAQAEALKSLGCHVDFLYIEEKGVKNRQASKIEMAFKQTKDYWKNSFYYIKVSYAENLYKTAISVLKNKLSGGHIGVFDQYPLGLTKYVAQLQKANNYEVCIVNYYYLTKLFDGVKFRKMACFTHDVFAYKNKVVSERVQWIDAHQEAMALQKCTDIFAVQDEERDYFKIIAPGVNIYNIYSKYSYEASPKVGNKNILFLSGNNVFNQNGLKWFIENVFPLIKDKYCDSKLLIAGGICKTIKGKYDHIPGIDLLGFVDDPKDFYRLGDVAINPTFQGTGLKIKTFEAIANDKVTIVHPHSTAGIYDKSNAPLFVSSEPSEWVGFITNIWENQDLVSEMKARNKTYMDSLNRFIISEYTRFINF